jgi:acetoacetyl-CoA synthetase
VFRDRDDYDIALRHASEIRPLDMWIWGRLRRETACVRQGLQGLGVGRGERVGGCLPNIREAIRRLRPPPTSGQTGRNALDV